MCRESFHVRNHLNAKRVNLTCKPECRLIQRAERQRERRARNRKKRLRQQHLAQVESTFRVKRAKERWATMKRKGMRKAA